LHTNCCAALQETFDAGLKLLPRFSVVHLMRLALRATATAAMRAFGPEGVKGFNLFAVEKLAINVATIERFAGRWVGAGGMRCDTGGRVLQRDF
jgi:hypothetical protein